MLEQEFLYTTKMISTNLANFSAWHQRSKLAPRLLSERKADDKARRAFMEHEFEQSLEALYTDPFNESVWVYHAWLMSNILPSSPQSEPIASYTEEESLQELNRQIDNLKELLELETECTHVYAALIRYATSLTTQVKEREQEIKSWLSNLIRLDPLRRGRWNDLAESLFKTEG